MLRKINLYKNQFGEIQEDQDERIFDLIQNYKDKDFNKLKRALAGAMLNEVEDISIIVYLTPQPTPRPRMGRSGVFYVQGSFDNTLLFERFVEEIGGMIKINTPCSLTIDNFMPIPKSMNSTDRVLAEMRRIFPISVPDWDNLGKTYSDMVRTHLLVEDSLIVDGRSRKYYSMKPRIEINFTFLKYHDSEYNKKKVMNWKCYDPELHGQLLTVYEKEGI